MIEAYRFLVTVTSDNLLKSTFNYPNQQIPYTFYHKSITVISYSIHCIIYYYETHLVEVKVKTFNPFSLVTNYNELEY